MNGAFEATSAVCCLCAPAPRQLSRGAGVCCDLDCRTDKLLHMAVCAISALAGRSDFPFICEVKEKSLVNQPGSNVRISFLEEDRTKQLATN